MGGTLPPFDPQDDGPPFNGAGDRHRAHTVGERADAIDIRRMREEHTEWQQLHRQVTSASASAQAQQATYRGAMGGDGSPRAAHSAPINIPISPQQQYPGSHQVHHAGGSGGSSFYAGGNSIGSRPGSYRGSREGLASIGSSPLSGRHQAPLLEESQPVFFGGGSVPSRPPSMGASGTRRDSGAEGGRDGTQQGPAAIGAAPRIGSYRSPPSSWGGAHRVSPLLPLTAVVRPCEPPLHTPGRHVAGRL